MKKKFVIFLLIFISLKSTTQNMIPNEILKKVFLLKYGSNTGTCFLVSINSNDYLITAKHIFSNTLSFNASIEIEILRNDGWVKLTPTLLTHENPNIDIAVLDLNTKDPNESLFDTAIL